MAVSWAAISRAWPGSSAHTSRSRKRRRPDRPSRNSRSMRGVSQTAAMRRTISAWLRGVAPSRRKTRRSVAPSGAVPVPISVSPSAVWNRAATAQWPLPSWRGRSGLRAPRRPRPGTSSDNASSRLVLPLPFGSVEHTDAGRRAPGQRRVVAEIGQNQSGEAEHRAKMAFPRRDGKVARDFVSPTSGSPLVSGLGAAVDRGRGTDEADQLCIAAPILGWTGHGGRTCRYAGRRSRASTNFVQGGCTMVLRGGGTATFFLGWMMNPRGKPFSGLMGLRYLVASYWPAGPVASEWPALIVAWLGVSAHWTPQCPDAASPGRAPGHALAVPPDRPCRIPPTRRATPPSRWPCRRPTRSNSGVDRGVRTGHAGCCRSGATRRSGDGARAVRPRVSPAAASAARGQGRRTVPAETLIRSRSASFRA